MSKIPEFQTERLILRGAELKDKDSYHKNFVDWQVISCLSNTVPWPYPSTGIEDFLTEYILPNQGKSLWYWGLFLKTKPDEMIGAIELRREPKAGHRGFWLGYQYWGQGYMAEAVLPTTDYAFNELGFEKLEFANASQNTQSRRIKEKTGAKLVRVQVATTYRNPEWDKEEIWEITKEDWLKFRNKSKK